MNSADPSLSVAQRVDAACDRFEAEWKAGRRPRMEDYLNAAPPSDREALRQALTALVLELQGRGAADTSASRSSVRSGDPLPPIRTAEYVGKTAETTAAVGRFEIRSVLGSGAFGKVYRAFDPQLGREVALKVPLEESVKTEAERSQFLKEARSAATINHPNVCQIHEVGEHGGRPYIVMALVPGQSLADLLKSRKKPLPEKQSALIVRKIASALAAAHSKSIVHRDLKPANVMFDKERKDVVVMDFGLARGPRLADAHGTQSGVIKGTPAYMSPEQARGESKAVGPAADVFSLGVILYELLTGTKPFQGTAFEVIGQILHVDPEAPSKRRPGMDPRLEAICLKAMAKDPAARFASMKEFATALDTVLRSAPPAGPTAETTRPERTRQGSELAGSETLGEVFAALSLDRKQARAETAAVVEAAIARYRTPQWVFLLAGLLLLGGMAALGGLVFFTRTDKVKVTLELTDVDLADKSLSFFLDDKPISAEALANPIELSPGDHLLEVKRGKTIVKRMLFTVKGGRNPVIKVKDLSPPSSDDLQKLQGVWDVTAEEFMGAKTKDAEIRQMNKVITFDGERMIQERNGGDGRRMRLEGIIRLNPQADPKTYDFSGVHYQGDRTEFRGLYELNGDNLRMIYNARNADEGEPARPTAFRTARGTSTVLMYAKRRKTSPPKSAEDADRELAEWLVSIGVAVRLSVDDGTEKSIGKDGDVRQRLADLPKKPFRMTSFDSWGNDKITDRTVDPILRWIKRRNIELVSFFGNPIGDETVRRLVQLPSLKRINLGGTKITPACIPELAQRTDLTELSLPNRPIGDAEIEKLRGLIHLSKLDLGSTLVSDAGLKHLRGMKELRYLALHNTAVTGAGLDELAGLPIERLGLIKTKVRGAEGLARLKKLPELKHVDLNGLLLSDADLKPLIECKSIVELEIPDNRITDAGLGELAKMKWLRFLRISLFAQTNLVTPAGVARLRKALPNCNVMYQGPDEPKAADVRAAALQLLKSGAKLDIRVGDQGFSVTDAAKLPAEPFAVIAVDIDGRKGADALLGLVKTHFPDVEGISFAGTDVTNAGMQHLRGMTKLQGVFCENNPDIDDRGFAALADLKNLRSIWTGNTPLGNDGARVLAGLPELGYIRAHWTKIDNHGLAILKKAPKLENLDMAGQAVTDAGLAHLKDYPALKSVSLAGMKITNDGLVHLQGMKKLEGVALNDTAITDAGLVHLAKCTQLKRVSLVGTKVTAQGLASLRKALPGCEIVSQSKP